MARRTISVVTSQGAKSPAAPVAISVAMRAIPSSPSPRPAPSSASAFGTTSVHASMSQALPSRPFQTSSSPGPNRPDRHDFCPSYGWTYARSGDLLEPTFEEGYDNNLSRDDFGLTPVPRIGTYRGLIFASGGADGISLDEHLGGIKEYIDLFVDLSPIGEIEIRKGVQKVRC